MTDKAFTLADTLRRYGPGLRPHKALAAGITAASVITSTFTVLAPIPLKLVIDEVLAGRVPAPFPAGLTPVSVAVLLACTAALFAGLAAIFSALEKSLSAKARERLTCDLRHACLEKFLTLTPLCRGRDRTGELTLRLVDDSQNVARLFTKTGPNILRHLLTYLMALAALFWVEPVLGLLGLAITAALAVMVRLAARPLSRAARVKRRQEGEVAGRAQEILRLLDFIQTSSSEGAIRERFARANDRALAAGVEETLVAVRLERLMQFANGIALAVIVGCGAVMALDGNVSAGGLAIAVLYLNQMLKPLEKINELASAVVQATSRAARLSELLDRPDPLDRQGTRAIERAQGRLLLGNTAFTYPSGKCITFGSAIIPAGSAVCITGPSGAGKSTLLALLTRLFDPSEGEIRLDGTPYRDWDIASLRRQFAIAPQAPPLLAGTVRDWLRLGNDEAQDEASWDALAAVALDKTIRLRGGLDAVLGEAGAGFSGGEQARLSLARALLADKPVLLLDEPLANVDARSARIILNALTREKGKRTILVISHQPLPDGFADLEFDIAGGAMRQPVSAAAGVTR